MPFVTDPTAQEIGFAKEALAVDPQGDEGGASG